MEQNEALKVVLEAANTQLDDIKSGIAEGLYVEEDNNVNELANAIALLESSMGRNGQLSPALVLITVSGGVSDFVSDGNVLVETVDFDNIEAGDNAPVLPDIFRDVVEKTYQDAYHHGLRYECENTKLELLYTDGGNSEVRETVVLSGPISRQQLERITKKLVNGRDFIAEQVGLPTPSVQHRGHEEWPKKEIDHVFTTIEQFEGTPSPKLKDFLTKEEPTHEMTIDQLVDRFNQVKRWDHEAEWQRLISLA